MHHLPLLSSSGLGYSVRVSTVRERIGEYRIVGEMVRTPTHVTYEGAHVVLPRRALLKVMAAPTEWLAVRALREACFLEMLQQHPGVARVYECARLSDRRPWFARELVEGPTIATRLGAGGFERIEVLSVIRQLADVLAHAHQRGVIHGGLRPNRIILCDRARGFPLCIADWSDARAHDAAPIAYTPAAGSWHYAAPELIAGERVDDRADVYSLGVLAYQMLTGALPARGPGEHVPTELRCPDAPPELTLMIDQMLAFERWDRPSAAEIRADLTWLGEMLATSPLRIRRPRWTPELAFDEPGAYALPVTTRTIKPAK